MEFFVTHRLLSQYCRRYCNSLETAVNICWLWTEQLCWKRFSFISRLKSIEWKSLEINMNQTERTFWIASIFQLDDWQMDVFFLIYLSLFLMHTINVIRSYTFFPLVGKPRYELHLFKLPLNDWLIVVSLIFEHKLWVSKVVKIH